MKNFLIRRGLAILIGLTVWKAVTSTGIFEEFLGGVEHMSDGARAQLQSHQSNSIMTGSGSPQAMSASSTLATGVATNGFRPGVQNAGVAGPMYPNSNVSASQPSTRDSQYLAMQRYIRYLAYQKRRAEAAREKRRKNTQLMVVGAVVVVVLLFKK